MEIIKGDNAVSCVFRTKNITKKFDYNKVKIDFDTNSSNFCYEFSFNGDVYKPDYVTFECLYKNLKCEVVKD